MPEARYMELARQVVAQGWCDPANSHKEMDADLAESIARRVAAWIETAAQHHRNEQYYRGLVVQIGEAVGADAYICDDGSRSDDVLCAKVPELVRARLAA